MISKYDALYMYKNNSHNTNRPILVATISSCVPSSVHVSLHQFMCSFISSCVPSSVHVSLHQFMCSFISSCVPSSVHVSLHQFMCSFISSCVPSSVHVSLHQFMCPFISSCVPSCDAMTVNANTCDTEAANKQYNVMLDWMCLCLYLSINQSHWLYHFIPKHFCVPKLCSYLRTLLA